MSEPKEALVKVIAILLSLFVLWALRRASWARREPLRERLLWCLVAAGAFGYVNFGGFHTDGTPFHIWDQYHYVLGSKYFPELGYDGIYVATIEAFEEKDPTFVPPPRIRDLKTNDVVPLARLAELQHQIRMRFSDSRWAAFREDATHYRIHQDIFLDHGYNPPPSRIAIERIFTAWLPFRQLSVALYASVDFLLLAIASVARKGTRNSIRARIYRRRLPAGRLRLHGRTRRGRVARIGTAPVAARRCNGAQRCWTYGPIQFESQQYARRTCRSVELICLYANFG